MSEPVPNVCPLCQGSHLDVRQENYVDPQSRTSYTLYECGACAGQFWWPLKNPGAHWYEHDVRYADRNQDPIREPNWNHKKVISFLKPLTGKVLDVGCGVGNFLAWADKNGWQSTGIDFDQDAIEAGKRMFGLTDLQIADVGEYAKQNLGKQFDLITFFDVLEHVDNHNEFIDHIRGLLKDGGYIAMSMPYRGHAEWLMTGDLPPRHLTRWDRGSLKTFLEARGFEVVYITRRSEGLRYLILKMRFRFGRRTSFGLVRKIKTSTGATTVTEQKTSAIRIAEILAKIKDAVLFGLPAIVVWLVMLPSRKRYITLYAIARKKSAN